MSKKYSRIAYGAIGAALLAYILIRAVRVGITYDEAWTLDAYVTDTYYHIISYKNVNANNHLLNSLLIKLLFETGSRSLFIARLPNVLAFALYAVFSYKLCSKYFSRLPGLACFLLLLVNPFLLDFFGLARGYGISLGFQMASLYFLFNYIKERSSGAALLSLSLGALAVAANFSSLYYWVAIFCAINTVALLSRKDPAPRYRIVYSLPVALALCLIVYEPIRKLRESGLLYYGGDSGFYRDTLASLAKYSHYSPDPLPATLPALQVFLAIFIAAWAASLYKERIVVSVSNAIVFLLIVIIACIELQHTVGKTLYPIDRSALFLYPLLICGLCFSLRPMSGAWPARAAYLVIPVVFSLNFLAHANLRKTALWYYDAYSEELLGWLNEAAKGRQKQLQVSYSWPFKNSFEYYHKKHVYSHISLLKKDMWDPGVPSGADYYVHLSHPLEKVGYHADNEQIVRSGWDTAKLYPGTFTTVYRRPADPSGQYP